MDHSDVAVKTAVAILCVGLIGGVAIYSIRPSVSPRKSLASTYSSPSAIPEQIRPLDLHHERWLRQAAESHDLLDETLADYPSARFKDVRGIVYGTGTHRRDYILCGQVNAKNRMGAYGGYRRFSISYSYSGNVIRIHFYNSNDLIAKFYCEGKGSVGERMAAEDRRMLNGPLDFDRDILPMMKELSEGKVKPAPVLKHSVSKNEYTAEISYSHKALATLSDRELWP